MFLPFFTWVLSVRSDYSVATCPHRTCKADQATVIEVADISSGKFCGCTNYGNKDFSFSEADNHPTYIPQNMFARATINKVTVSKFIQSIETGAFDDCKITTLDLGSAEALTSVSQGAFYLAKITSAVTFPEKCTSFGESSFERSKMVSLDFSKVKGMLLSSNRLFYHAEISDTLTFPQSIDTSGGSIIGEDIFFISEIKKLDLSKSSSITTLYPNIFSNVFVTESFVFHPQVTKIQDNAFQGANIKGTFKLPQKLLSVSSEAFSSCTLETLDFSAAADYKTIGQQSFKSVKIEKGITFNNKLETIGNKAFENSVINTLDMSTATSLEDIQSSAFKGAEILQKVVLPTSLKSIGTNAFEESTATLLTLSQATNLHTIDDDAFLNANIPNVQNFPASLLRIGKRAFKGTKLQTVNCHENSKIFKIDESAFEGIITLFSGRIKALLIEDNAFSGCYNLVATIDILPGGKVGDNAFKNCYQLEGPLTISPFSKLNTTIGSNAFQNAGIISCTIPEIKLISSSAFENCSRLESISSLNVETISASAFRYDSKLVVQTIRSKLIAANAFEQCRKLGAEITLDVTYKKDYELPDDVLIGESAFAECNNLETLNINVDETISNITTVTSLFNTPKIGKKAFHRSGLKGPLNIPFIVKDIGEDAFSFTPSLNSLTIEPGKTIDLTIQNQAFYHSAIANNLFIPYQVISIGELAFAFNKIPSLTIAGTGLGSDEYTSIDSRAFYSCNLLKKLTFGDDNTHFDKTVFRGCLLEKLELGEGIDEIPEEAFYGMSSITGSINIPNSVESVGSRAFSGCNKINEISFSDGSQCASIGDAAFYGCTAMTKSQLPKLIEAISPYRPY
ncbi:hypothetical protein M9Y10_023102 [Tritrichomonas musculus]|uniref:Surface antigen BspA-like n=1 Tax=Tritrichomonas musculus TaxID=1915356 RepID=A0ABR2KXE1_9EUKA